jgi:hypothetical protein
MKVILHSGQDVLNVKKNTKPYLNLKNMKKISVYVHIVLINMSMKIYQETHIY